MSKEIGKEIPMDMIRKAVKSLNAYLEKNGKEKIVHVAISKPKIIEKMLTVIMNHIDEGVGAELPNTVIDFYNNQIVPAEEAAQEAVETTVETAEVETVEEKPVEKKEKPVAKRTRRRKTRQKVDTPKTDAAETPIGDIKEGLTELKEELSETPTEKPEVSGKRSLNKKSDEKKKTLAKKSKGVVALIVDGILGEGVDPKDIDTYLKEKHGVTSSKSTISNVNCVLGHVMKYVK